MWLHLDEKPDIIVFLDGDYSDYPEELTKLVEPILNDDVDFVIGARVKRLREQGSMTVRNRSLAIGWQLF